MQICMRDDVDDDYVDVDVDDADDVDDVDVDGCSLLAAVHRFRNHRVIKASSPFFLYIILLGQPNSHSNAPAPTPYTHARTPTDRMFIGLLRRVLDDSLPSKLRDLCRLPPCWLPFLHFGVLGIVSQDLQVRSLDFVSSLCAD